MRRLFLLMVVLMAGAVTQVQAASMDYMDADKDGKVTLAEFIAARKAGAEKRGVAFEEAVVKATFDKKDLDKDGVLSAAEQDAVPAPKAEKK